MCAFTCSTNVTQLLWIYCITTLNFRFKKLNNLKERQNAEDVSKCNDLQEKEATRTTKLTKTLKEKVKGPLTKHVENLLKSLKNKNDHNISLERR